MNRMNRNEVLFLSAFSDESLRVCLHPGPTCCTSKMEESYMAAVRGETQQKIQSYSFELKYLIAGHIKAYQGRKESLTCVGPSHDTLY